MDTRTKKTDSDETMFGADWEILVQYLQSHPEADRLSPEEFSYYIRVGIGVGEGVACTVLRRYGEVGPEAILRLKGVSVASEDAPVATGVQILAEFRPSPPQVTVYPQRHQAVIARLPLEHQDYFSPYLMDISLAHELYHFLWETQYRETEWTDLVQGLGYSPLLFEVVPPARVLHSPLTQEFAALQFSKSLLSLSRSPALLCLADSEE